MKVFVTGGAGFIGSHTVSALLHGGHDVTMWDDLSTGERANIEAVIDHTVFVEGDIRDFESLRSAVRQSRVDTILHLAAIPSVPPLPDIFKPAGGGPPCAAELLCPPICPFD